MAESRPGGDKADPWYADPESEIPSVDEISGYDVILSYGNTYVVVTLKSEGKVQFAYRDAEISPPRITDKPGQDLVWLDLDVRAGYSVVALRLPFYAKDIDRLHAFKRALTVPLSGHAGLAQAQPDDEAETAAPDRDQPGSGDPAGKRDLQDTPVVSISTWPATWADGEDWISLRPTAETERLLQPPREETAEPEPENPRRG